MQAPSDQRFLIEIPIYFRTREIPFSISNRVKLAVIDAHVSSIPALSLVIALTRLSPFCLQIIKLDVTLADKLLPRGRRIEALTKITAKTVASVDRAANRNEF